MASRKGWTARVLIGAVAGLLLIALAAVPSFGASKKFALDVKPNTAFATVSTDYTITIKNTSPGNSTINSFSVDVPFPLQSGTTVTATQPLPSSDNANAQATVNVVGSQVRVTNIDPIKTNQVLKIGITATAADPGSATCSTTPYTWTAAAYAGNSLGGDTFAPTATAGFSSTVQLQSASCIHVQFVSGKGPHDAIQGQTITSTDLNEPAGDPVQVELVAGGTRVDVTTSGQPVALSISSFNGSAVPPAAPGVLTGNTADFTNGLASFPDLKISNAATTPPTAGGDYQLKASYLSYPSIASDTFQIFDAQICGSGSSEGEETYTELSETTTQGQVTINTTNDDCFAIIVDNNDLRDPGSTNIEEWSVTKSTTTKMQGTLDFVWDLPGTTPVKWTQVTWDGLNGAYHDVQLCNPGVAVDDYDNLFPTIPGSTYGAEQMCLFSSALVNTASGWTQLETVAYNTDYGGRK
jgi:hypothetical protein